MAGMLRFDVYGRSVGVERDGDDWSAVYLDADGKRRPADDIFLPPTLDVDDLRSYLADLCHEWATPAHPEVRLLSS